MSKDLGCSGHGRIQVIHSSTRSIATVQLASLAETDPDEAGARKKKHKKKEQEAGAEPAAEAQGPSSSTAIHIPLRTFDPTKFVTDVRSVTEPAHLAAAAKIKQDLDGLVTSTFPDQGAEEARENEQVVAARAHIAQLQAALDT